PIAPPAMAPPQFAPADPACGGARSRAAQMVCGDPELAAADREMNQAFRRALRSGAAPDQLRQDQRYWLAIR
ncbi:MAG: lysozyme inhibitor LprI family protein, partial [Caulobacterales bacterium]